MLTRLAKVRVQRTRREWFERSAEAPGGQREIKLMEEAYFKCQSSQATVYPRNLAETSGSLTNCTSSTSRTRTPWTPSGGLCSSPSTQATVLLPMEIPPTLPPPLPGNSLL